MLFMVHREHFSLRTIVPINYIILTGATNICCESQAGSFLNNRLAEQERESCLLYFNYGVSFCVLCFFLMVPCVGLQSVSVSFSGHTRLLSYYTPHWQKYVVDRT